MLAEDREKSTPMICANEDFFPQIPDLKNTDKTRVRAAGFWRVRDFHNAFHKIFVPKVLRQNAPNVGMNQRCS
jgi:hypothetical protein